MILPIHKERMLALAAFLDKLPAERFVYTRWVGGDWGGMADLSCGTKACALGWASTMSMFRKLGLRLTTRYGDSFPELAGYKDHTSAEIIFVIFGRYDGITELFFPSPSEAEMGPKEVAEKMRSWIRLQERQENKSL